MQKIGQCSRFWNKMRNFADKFLVKHHVVKYNLERRPRDFFHRLFVGAEHGAGALGVGIRRGGQDAKRQYDDRRKNQTE